MVRNRPDQTGERIKAVETEPAELLQSHDTVLFVLAIQPKYLDHIYLFSAIYRNPLFLLTGAQLPEAPSCQ